MSEPENFLTRWSRRKRVTEEPARPAPAVAPDKPAPDGAPADKPKSKPAAETPEPAFDPASLPSLDSIGAQTDIRAFLQPGVPGELRLAALRRAWTMDPAIRDYKGLAENDWDFTKPNSMMGFGELDPSIDIKKMLAQIFGDTPRADGPHTETPALAEQPTPPSHELRSPVDRAAREHADESARASEIPDPQQIAAAETDKIVQRDENIASQENSAEPGDVSSKRRRPQGSALPE